MTGIHSQSSIVTNHQPSASHNHHSPLLVALHEPFTINLHQPMWRMNRRQQRSRYTVQLRTECFNQTLLCTNLTLRDVQPGSLRRWSPGFVVVCWYTNMLAVHHHLQMPKASVWILHKNRRKTGEVSWNLMNFRHPFAFWGCVFILFGSPIIVIIVAPYWKHDWWGAPIVAMNTRYFHHTLVLWLFYIPLSMATQSKLKPNHWSLSVSSCYSLY